MMASPATLTGPINMGNPGEFTILELAETILRMVGGRSRLVMRPLPQDDPQQRQPDISLAKTALNWSPQVHLEEGLTRTIDYFKNLLAS